LLAKEARLLQEIGKQRIAPRFVELFTDWEHLFLAQEFCRGLVFPSHIATRSAAILSSACASALPEYYAGFFETFERLSQSLLQLHNMNIVFGDLSPRNVIIEEETETPLLIDFEGAYQIGVDTPVNICTPGYAPRRRQALSPEYAPVYRDDLFGLGALMLAYLLPINSFIVQAEDAPNCLRTLLS
jgi:serine/threonine protein kinase